MISKLPDLETQQRIANALEQGLGLTVTKYPFKVYGITGLGGENPQLRRTHDAEGVEIVITENEDDSDLLNATLTDPVMHEFFNFAVYEDANGNFFVEGRPLAIKFFLTANREVVGYGVAEYFDGIEIYGFRPFTANKKWITQNAYNGVGSIPIAKYLSAAWNVQDDDIVYGHIHYDYGTHPDDTVVTSRPGLDYAQSYAEWDIGMEVIKNTDSSYNMMHWSYGAYQRLLALVFFANTNIFKIFDIEFPGYDDNGAALQLNQETITGTTDNIVSHTGFNKATNQFKVFNIDAFIAQTNLQGAYFLDYEYYYSHLVDSDAKYDEGYLKSSILAVNSYRSGEYDIITKMEFDPSEPDFQMPTALRMTTADKPEDSVSNIFYSSKAKIAAHGSVDVRIRFQQFSYYIGRFAENSGLNYVRVLNDFGDAWNDTGSGSLRLCKPPF